MLIKRISLNNFGGYYGLNTLSLDTSSSDKNTILIGGENGAGKTTLLNSIKVGLFGPFAFGFKTVNNQYTQFIIDYLNRHAIKSNTNQSNYYIEIEFLEVENYQENKVLFKREWKYNSSRNNIEEFLSVFINDHLLDDSEKDIYIERLRESMPPELFDLCLFDGEEISRIVNGNNLANHFQNLARVVFSLNLFESLEGDLNNFIHNSKTSNHLSNIEKQILDKESEINNFNDELDRLNDERENYDTNLEELKQQLKEKENDFKIHGGLYKEERDQLIGNINEIETTRKENQTQVKEYFASLLPFHLNKSLLKETVDQLENESSLQIYENVSRELSEDKLENIINELNLDHTEEVQNNLKNSILKQVKPKHHQKFHNASFAQRSQVENLHTQLDQQTPEDILSILNENQELLLEAQNYRKKVAQHDETKDFTHMIQEIEQLRLQIEQEEQNYENLLNNIQYKQSELDEAKRDLESLEKEKNNDYKNQNAFELSKSIIEVSKEFRKIQQQKKLQEVQTLSIDMLNLLMRKENYIVNINIDPLTFDFTLYDHNQEMVELANLSAGEKEVLLLSITWAMFYSAGRKVPFIFDTLLGRLDATHRSNILKQLIPNSGDQVLILSTDTEISEKNYELLQPHLVNEYTLHFDVEERKVNIQNGFFYSSNEVS